MTKATKRETKAGKPVKRVTRYTSAADRLPSVEELFAKGPQAFARRFLVKPGAPMKVQLRAEFLAMGAKGVGAIRTPKDAGVEAGSDVRCVYSWGGPNPVDISPWFESVVSRSGTVQQLVDLDLSKMLLLLRIDPPT